MDPSTASLSELLFPVKPTRGIAPTSQRRLTPPRFGAHLAMKGASPKAIQELLRHADLAMTGRYTHLSPTARESAVRLLDASNSG